MIERPLDLLGSLRGKDCSICLKGKDEMLVGKLHAFDIHINLVIEIGGVYRFIRGDEVRWVDGISPHITMSKRGSKE